MGKQNLFVILVTIEFSGQPCTFSDRFIAEESSSKDAKLPELTDAPTWFIDPIDGTTNFIHRFSHCCISIGLTVCKQLELGIIYNPTNGEMYSAVRGEGAFLNGKPIKTSGVESKCAPILVTNIYFFSPFRKQVLIIPCL